MEVTIVELDMDRCVVKDSRDILYLGHHMESPKYNTYPPYHYFKGPPCIRLNGVGSWRFLEVFGGC